MQREKIKMEERIAIEKEQIAIEKEKLQFSRERKRNTISVKIERN